MAEKRNATRLPSIACEVTPHAVGAVRTEDKTGTPGTVQRFGLHAGVLTPSLTGLNVQNPQALSAAIAQALMAVGGRGQEVIAVLPDSAVRVTLLDFDELPERRQEAEATVRFRLRKSLPFDIEKAAVSFDAQRTSRGLRVVASIVLHSVLEEYELAFREAGCSPGVVLPSSLAALGAVSKTRPTMVLKVGQDATAVAVSSEGRLLFFRTLEGAGSSLVTAAQLADDLYPSLVYFQDHHGMSVEQLLVSGVEGLREIAGALEELTGARVQQLISASLAAEKLSNEFAGAIGALL
jgi:type IV pilus assembly protein PilM